MEDKKYNKVLTIVLVIIGIAIFGVIGFIGYDVIKKNADNRDQNKALEEFENRLSMIRNTTSNQNTNTNNNQSVLDGNVSLNFNINETVGGNNNNNNNNNNSGSNNNNNSSNVAKQTYKGYTMLGRLSIPSISLDLPVLDRASEASMKVSVGVLYGVGLNQIGNTVIAGHNYRNGTFFSNLKKVKNGDLIYITDNSGKKIKYTVYNVYTTTSSDFDYASRDTAGKREVSLTTCTDDVNARQVIWAKED